MSKHNIYWLTGLPCSGKSTIAKELSRHLYSEIIDGDSLRSEVGNRDFSDISRSSHMRYVSEMAGRLSNFIEVIVSLVSPIKDERDYIKARHPNVHEIYVKCPLDMCIQRDTKGMYAKALKGEIADFTGISKPYEEPVNPSLVLETDKSNLDECVKRILTLQKTNHRSLLIGRWQPLHDGHKWLVAKAQEDGNRVVLGIRNTSLSRDNPYSVQERIDMIQKMFGDSVDYIVLPDISAVYYGRDAGYRVEQLIPPENIANVSATQIRRQNEHR